MIHTEGGLDKKIRDAEKEQEHRTYMAGRLQELDSQGIHTIRLERDIAVYRIDDRLPQVVLENGGYNPWNLGEQAVIIPISNVPDQLRHQFAEPVSQTIGGKEGDPRSLDVHPMYMKMPSNPGANMGITCTAVNPYGSLSAIGKGTKRWYMAIIASNEGIPVTSLYQTQDMLEAKINNLGREKRGILATDDQAVVTFSAVGDRVLTFDLKAGAGNTALGNRTISVVEKVSPDGSSEHKLLITEYKKHNILIKDGEHKGFIVEGDSRLHDFNGNLIQGMQLSDFTLSRDQWIPNTVEKELNKDNLKAVLKSTVDIGDDLLASSKEEISKRFTKSKKHEPHDASFEFEFSNHRQGIGDIAGWAEITIDSGLQYKVHGYTPNPYFDKEKHHTICADRHYTDIMRAATQLASNPSTPVIISVYPSEIVTPLSAEVVTNHCSKDLTSMESTVREKAEFGDKLKKMQDTIGRKDPSGIPQVKTYEGKEFGKVDLTQIVHEHRGKSHRVETEVLPPILYKHRGKRPRDQWTGTLTRPSPQQPSGGRNL